MKSLNIATILSTLLLAAGAATAGGPNAHAVPGEKLDSGLGEMAPYRASAVLGEKLDSGLGDIAPYRAVVAGQKLDSGLGNLPHYRYWTDKTGRAPMQGEQVAQVGK